MSDLDGDTLQDLERVPVQVPVPWHERRANARDIRRFRGAQKASSGIKLSTGPVMPLPPAPRTRSELRLGRWHFLFHLEVGWSKVKLMSDCDVCEDKRIKKTVLVL